MDRVASVTTSRPLAGVPDPVTVRAPAKVNLALAVGPLGDDGYHPIETVFQAVSLYDELTATAAEGISVTVEGEGAEKVGPSPDNIATRAAVLLAERTECNLGAHLQIKKAIPVAGGMAGGSADAAAALVACDALWGTGLDRDALVELAAELGADIPFSLVGGTALGVGRGDVLTPVLARGTYHWVFAIAWGGLRTPDVYAEFDRRGKAGLTGTEDVLAALRAGDALALGRVLSNDLQESAVALRPELGKVLRAGVDLGAVGAVVSGSGPTVALLVRDGRSATALAAALAAEDVCRAVRIAHGPVPGVRIVDGADGLA